MDRWDSIEEQSNKLEGCIIQKVFIDSNNLKLITDKGTFCWVVEGDCCSCSYFHDFIGVENLFKGKIIGFEDIDLPMPETISENIDCLQVYGRRFIINTPDLGELTAVLSFRNESNGYYGGSMEPCAEVEMTNEITTDWFND